MALIKCPECGKEVSDKASSCPNCGNPIIEKVPKLSVNKTSDKKLDTKLLAGSIMVLIGGVISIIMLISSSAATNIIANKEIVDQQIILSNL